MALKLQDRIWCNMPESRWPDAHPGSAVGVRAFGLLCRVQKFHTECRIQKFRKYLWNSYIAVRGMHKDYKNTSLVRVEIVLKYFSVIAEYTVWNDA